MTTKNKNLIQKTLNEKWYPILRGEKGNTCSLCKEFRCQECLIYGKTNKHLCDGTPFEGYYYLRRAFIHWNCYDLHAEVTAAAQWEIDFLEDLMEGE